LVVKNSDACGAKEKERSRKREIVRWWAFEGGIKNFREKEKELR
jgi:hypothetical protein